MIRDLLYPGSTTRIWAHVETPFKKGSRPIDQSRYLFDSNDPVAVLADCARAVSQGVQVFMYNSYAHGSYEDISREVWFAATQKAGMNQLINVDGANISSLRALQLYIAYTKTCIARLPNYEKWQGKPIVTYFAKSGEDPAWFQQVEAENPDLCFIYYGTNYGKNRMDWIHVGPDPTIAQGNFCKQYATKKDGGLYVPCVFTGFDDTVMRNGKPTSVWNPNLPARVSPAEGPNAATWAKCFQNINANWSASNQLPFLQEVTWNDLDEGTDGCRGIRKL